MKPAVRVPRPRRARGRCRRAGSRSARRARDGSRQAPAAAAAAAQREACRPTRTRRRAARRRRRGTASGSTSSGAGPRRSRSFVVYPERKDKAPVVIVIHEIFGMTDWVRGVADQLAKEGFIAIAPDFLSGKGPTAAAAMRSATARDRRSARCSRPTPTRSSTRCATYALTIPSSNGKIGVDRILLGRPHELPLRDHAAGAERGRCRTTARCRRIRPRTKKRKRRSSGSTAETTTA